jgi:hypothetical protein
MTLSPVTTAARAALSQPAQHQFGIRPSVPDDTITALQEAHQIILARLHNPATATQALREWTEALYTVHAITEVIGYGVAELAPHLDDLLLMAGQFTTSGKILIDAALSKRLDDCADLIDAVMSFAPHEVVVACAEACEAMGVRR